MEAADALSISELYDVVEEALAERLPPRSLLWVRGEIQRISESRGHRYIDLVDADTAGERWPTKLSVKCWQGTWRPLASQLAAQGFELADGMSVVLGGEVDLFRGRGELSLILKQVDVEATLGRMAVDRAKLIEQLRREGLFEAQARLELPPVPLRVGLVASWNTEGCNDFLGQLERSPFAFRVLHAQASVQGGGAPGSVAAAIDGLAHAGVDLICVVRGGGSRGDLAAFDAEPVARAVATAPVPVLTGIGHSGDRSIADDLASFAAITPTALGHHVVGLVATYAAEVGEAAAAVSDGAELAVERAVEAQQRQRRALSSAVAARLAEANRGVRRSADRLPGLAREALRRGELRRLGLAARIGPMALAHLDRGAERLAGIARLCAAHDPARVLAAGYSITRDAAGAIVRSPGQVAVGDRLLTSVAGGTLTSRVEAEGVAGGAPDGDG